jgi:hypothetical protein
MRTTSVIARYLPPGGGKGMKFRKPLCSHEQGHWKSARGHRGVESKDVDNHRRQHCCRLTDIR